MKAIDKIQKNPHKYNFFALYNLLKKDYEIALSSHMSLGFKANDIESCVIEDQTAKIKVNFFGISGGIGALPIPVVEKLIFLMKDKNFAIADFLDIFNKRLIKMLYEINRKNHMGIANELQDKNQVFCSLKQLAANKNGFAKYAGAVFQNPKSAWGLERLINDVLKVKVNVIPFAKSLKKIPAKYLKPLGQKSILKDMPIGRNVYLQDASIKVMIECQNYEKYADFLPKGNCHEILKMILNEYAYAFKVYIFLRFKFKKATALDRKSILNYSTPLSYADQYVLIGS